MSDRNIIAKAHLPKKFRSGLYRLQKALMEKGLMKGKKGQERFVILSRSRTGSNLLLSYLNSHSMIRCHGEVFNFERSEKARAERRNAEEDPIAYLEKKVFHAYPAVIRAVGFKLFYYHAPKEPLSKVWEFLRDDPELHVLHLRRANILRAHLSRTIAGKTQVWSEWKGERNGSSSKANPIVHLDPKSCIEDISQTLEWERWARQVFGHRNNYLELTYEELTQEPESTLKKILRSLKLPQEPMNALTQKQNDRPIRELVENPEELEKELEKHGMGDYLNEAWNE